MSKEEKNKKWNKIFKNTFSQKILSSSWEKEGMEVRNSINILNNINR